MKKGSFTKVVLATAKEFDFGDLALQCLKELLGEPCTFSLIYYIGKATLQDPQVFENGLRSIFGEGAEPLLNYILLKLEET